MTSREGYDAYTLYLGIKLHFINEEYNFIKYNGKVKATSNPFSNVKISIISQNYIRHTRMTCRISTLQIYL